MSIKFYCNSNILVIGATNSGKTTTILEIIKQQLIEPMPSKSFICMEPGKRSWISGI